MKISNVRATTHVFICGPCLAESEAMNFSNRLKRLAASRWKKDIVRVTNVGCLGHCNKRINCVIYPQGIWVSKLALDDELSLIRVIDEALKN